MRAVNLLPRDAGKRDRKPGAPLMTAVAAAVAVTTVLCAGFLLESAKVTHKRNELAAARTALALVPPPPAKPAGASAELAGQEAQRVSALQTALQGRVSWDRVLREISLVLPNDVWLSSLTLASPTAGTGTPFAMSGNAFSHDGVARLLSRLSLVPDLANVELDHSSRVTPGKHGAVEFKVTADIRAPGATSS